MDNNPLTAEWKYKSKLFANHSVHGTWKTVSPVMIVIVVILIVFT